MSCSGCARLAIDLGTGLPRFARNVVGRDFAVGDIHGCFGHLSRALEAIGFDAVSGPVAAGVTPNPPSRRNR